MPIPTAHDLGRYVVPHRAEVPCWHARRHWPGRGAARMVSGNGAARPVRSPLHQFERAAHVGASALRDAEDARALRHLADGGDERHAAAVGENASRRALDNASVARLYLSPRYVKENAMRAESAVRAALAQGADIETVSGNASATLDAMGGIAARLRYSTR